MFFAPSFLLLLHLLVLPFSLSAEEAELRNFADPVEFWGSGVEALIEQAYRSCFKTYIFDDLVMTLRMPFAQNDERAELAVTDLKIQGSGKADPEALWTDIDSLLGSEDFHTYKAALMDGNEKVMIFDLSSKSWTWTRDLFELARMKAGAYRGLPHRPYVLVSGTEMKSTDVYNYLYSIGRVGMDCSGFVWHVLSTIARSGGLDLGENLRGKLGVPKGADPSLYAGTWFFGSRSSALLQVEDRIENLKPGDVMIFLGSNGGTVHSALIQSVDYVKGSIRYMQSTDEAPLEERGVHESFIFFDPEHPERSLKDASLGWTQKRFPPFPGEKPSSFSDDGERYRAYPEYGGGRVVRLKVLASLVLGL